jgi:hypothetical protein
MRRVIERVVTVVTTTTWKISWETDPPHPEPQVASIFTDLPTPDVFSETPRNSQANPPVIETKEVEPARIKSLNESTTGQPSQESYSYPSENKRKSKP